MAGQLQQSGAAPQKQPKYVPLFIDRAFTGLYTQRNVLHDPSDIYTAKYYGGRPDALWQGRNIELTNRLTLQRRPGLTAFSSATYPTAPNRAYSFHLTNGTIQVIVDTSSTSTIALTSVATSVGSTAVYTGTITGGAGNAYAGLLFTVSGFTQIGNNTATSGFVCVASTATTITLANPSALAEFAAGSAISAGAVFVDNQNGTKTLLFAKSPGAGQAYFVAVAGILFIGDGVDIQKYTPGNTNGSVWNWGIATPTSAPILTTTQSAAAAVAWAASTVFSTMGLIVDGNGNAEALISVNNKGTNATQIGTSGNGEPAWNQNPGGTTTDGTVVWTNWGPIPAWTAHTLYNNASLGGNSANASQIYDPVSQTLQINGAAGFSQATSGSSKPNFVAIQGANIHDPLGGNTPPNVKWFTIFPAPTRWQPTHAYQTFGGPNPPLVGVETANSCVVEPFNLPAGAGQTVYLQICTTAGTSAGSGTQPPFPALGVSGVPTGDGDLVWLSLGSATRQNNTSYTAWSGQGSVFGAVKVNGRMYVCTVSGVSAGSLPAEFSGPSFYGSTISDGTATWVDVGPTMSWTSSTKWFLPISGFAPPSQSQTYGGADVVDSSTPANLETVVASGLSGALAPTWSVVKGGSTPDNGTVLTLTQVTVAGSNVTYTGTITGGAANAFQGQSFLIAGFVNAGNNLVFTVTASTATTLVGATTSQANETHAGTATKGLIWYNLGAATTNALVWKTGHVYAYSYKSRASSDFYSTLQTTITSGGLQVTALPVPPGLPNPLPPATGSLTGVISSASPIFTITGANTGAVNTLQIPYSNDPQVDTIVIWRDADGGGKAQMFELTELQNIPQPAGTTKFVFFQDFLPDAPSTIGGVQYPGLNPLIPAPINGVNNPPASSFLPMVYNFQRIWGASGSNVFFSGGPDTLAGNPNEAFNIADEFPFLAPVVRLVKTTQGIVTFLTDSIEIIGGGPSTTSFFSITLAPGIGLLSYNALDQFAGELYFFSADNQFRMMTPSLNVSNAGFPLGDQFANLPSSGVSDTTWNPSKVYVSVFQNGTDNCMFIADGSTGWYRLNPHQVPGAAQGPEPIWSPYAAVTNGCKMVQAIETQPGIKRLLVGGTGNSQPILKRDLAVFTDNGTPYNAFFTMGSITLAHPGQLALLKFLEFDFSGVKYQPTISYLLNDVAGTFTPFVLKPVFDPPSVYGATIVPGSYSPDRYYFAGNASLARARHLQIKVDLGNTTNGDELFTMTIFGRLMVEV